MKKKITFFITIDMPLAAATFHGNHPQLMHLRRSHRQQVGGYSRFELCSEGGIQFVLGTKHGINFFVSMEGQGPIVGLRHPWADSVIGWGYQMNKAWKKWILQASRVMCNQTLRALFTPSTEW